MANNTGRRRLRNLNFYGYTDRPEMDGTDVFGELRKQQLINIGQQLEIDDLYVTIQVDSGNTNYLVYQGPNLVGEIKVDTVVRRAWYDPTQHALILVIGSEGGEETEVVVPFDLPAYYPEEEGPNAYTTTFRTDYPQGTSGEASYYISVNIDHDTLSAATVTAPDGSISGHIYARIDEELSPKSHLSVANSAVTTTIWDDELAVAKALHELKKTKQKLLSGGSGIQIYRGDDVDLIESKVFVSVDRLPLKGEENLIYLKPLEDDPDLFGEYAWIDNQWVCIGGSTIIDKWFDPASPYGLANSAITKVISEDEEAVSKALFELKKTKQKVLSAGTGVHIYEGENFDLLESRCVEVVDHLPLEGEENIIYVIGAEEPVSGNVYSEYAWIDGAWELIGGSGIIDKWFDSASTHALVNSAITKVISEDELATAKALLDLEHRKQERLIAGGGIQIYKGDGYDLIESTAYTVVDHLPMEGEENLMYLVPVDPTLSGKNNVFAEYIWVDGDWEILGGAAITDFWFDSGSTFPLVNSAITKVISEDELAVSKALHDLEKRKQKILSAGTGIKIYEGKDYDLIESQNFTVVDHLPLEGEENLIYFIPLDPTLSAESNVFAEYIWVDGQWETLGAAAITDDWFDSGSTFPLVNSAITKVISEDELATAKALINLNKTKQKRLKAGTGIKIYEGLKEDLIESQNFTVVDHLPLEGEENLIYFMPLDPTLTGESNVFAEYIWVDGQWETLGAAAISDYWFDSGSTFPLVNSAITKVISEDELATAKALIDLDKRKQKVLEAGTGIKIYEGKDKDIIESQNFVVVDHLPYEGEENLIYFLPLDPTLSAESNVFAEYIWVDGQWETLGAAAIADNWFDSGSTFPLVNSAITKVISEDELAVAKALIDLDKRKQKTLEAGTGIKIYEGKDKDIIESQNFVVVDHLPYEGEENLIYFMPLDPTLTGESNVFAEYIWVDGEWETLGAAAISDYWFDSGSTFPLVNSAITKVISEDELAIAKALIDLDKRKQEKLVAGTGIKIYEGDGYNLIESQNFTVVDHLPYEGEENLIYFLPLDPTLSAESNVFAEYIWVDGQWETLGAAAITDDWFDSGSTFPLVNSAITKVISEDELATAKALIDLDKRKQKTLEAGTGIKIYEGKDKDIIESQNFVVVDHLPYEGEENLIYFMPLDPTLTGESNVFAEYIWVDGEWETLGAAAISDYWFDSGSTFPLVNSAITKVISEDELAVAKALIDLDKRKQEKLVAGSGVKIYEGDGYNLIESQNFTVVDHLPYEGEENLIYLLPLEPTLTGDSNVYAEYVWIDGKWETLGAAAITDDWFDSGSTFPLVNSAITKVISEDELATAKALIDLDKRKQKNLTAGSGIKIYEGQDSDVIESQNFVVVDHLPLEGEENLIYFLPLDPTLSAESNVFAEYIWVNNEWETLGAAAITDDWFDSGSTFPLVNSAITKVITEDELAIAKALFDLDKRKQKNLTAGSGIRIYEGQDTDIIESQNFIIVDHLPMEGEENLIYLMPADPTLTGESNVYAEYIWTDGAWEILGSAPITDFWFDSGSTFPLVNSAITKVISEDELATAKALHELKQTKQKNLTAGVGIKIYEGEESDLIESQNFTLVDHLPMKGEEGMIYLLPLDEKTSGESNSYGEFAWINDQWEKVGGAATTDEWFDSASTMPLANSAITKVISEDEEAVAKALLDLEKRKQKILSAGTGVQIFEGKDVDLIESQSFVLVDHLPLEGKENIIYLLPLDEKSSGETNAYGEYAWIDGDWEKVGGSSTTDEWFSSASTFPLANSAITKAFSDDEKATAEALHELRATKQKVLTAGAGIRIYEGNDSDVIESQNYIVVDQLPLEGEDSLVYLLPMGEAVSGEPQSYGEYVWVNGEWATVGSTTTTDMWFDSASTMPLANSAVTKVATDDELTIAEALTELRINKQDKLVAGKNINIYADNDKQEIEGIPYVIVEELPETGETDTIYVLTTVSSTNVRSYTPYIYDNYRWYTLGGSSVVDEAFDSGSTNALANSVITKEFYDLEEVVADGLFFLKTHKQKSLSAGTNITLVDDGVFSGFTTINSQSYQIVDTLPTNPVSNTMYLLKVVDGTSVYYDAYCWIDESWRKPTAINDGITIDAGNY